MSFISLGKNTSNDVIKGTCETMTSSANTDLFVSDSTWCAFGKQQALAKSKKRVTWFDEFVSKPNPKRKRYHIKTDEETALERFHSFLFAPAWVRVPWRDEVPREQTMDELKHDFEMRYNRTR